MINNPVIFYSASAVIILFAFIALLARNVINSLLAAIVVFFCGALFFYVLGSEYNAIIQAAVYGFAVPVIIGVSITFIGVKKDNIKIPYPIFITAGIFVLAFVYLMLMSLVITPDTFNIMELVQVNAFDTLRAFASGIFVNYVWAFELVSLLLTIVIAGLGVIGGKSWK